MAQYNSHRQPTQQDLMDAEAAGFAAAIGKIDSRARESYIRNWGSIEIMESYSKGFAEGFSQKRVTIEHHPQR